MHATIKKPAGFPLSLRSGFARLRVVVAVVVVVGFGDDRGVVDAVGAGVGLVGVCVVIVDAVSVGAAVGVVVVDVESGLVRGSGDLYQPREIGA